MVSRSRCAHCRAAPGVHRWEGHLCADGGRKRVHYLCGPCDVELNRQMLAFFNVPDAAAKAERYAAQG